MALSLRNRHPRTYGLATVLAALVLAARIAPAAEGEARERSFEWSADKLDSDLRLDTLDLKGNVRVTQGATSISAGQAHATAFRSENSHWTFEREVQIQTAQANLSSALASASFVSGEIAGAQVEGKPAQFEQRGTQADRQVRGRAGRIEYDFAKGIVTLTGDVWFAYGKDEFHGDTVIYSIRDEVVRVNPAGSASGRVKGTIRPREPPVRENGA